ncbi:MAG: SUF system Fe-S cluster assembly protein [Pseudomonadota bacterium]
MSESTAEQTTLADEGEPIIRPSSTEHALYDHVVEACRTVFDPEIPVNIYDLGLIYSIRIDEESNVAIDMTLTAPGCPVAGEMPGWVADAVEPLSGVKTVEVHMVWEPPWGMDRLTEDARLELGLM